MPLRIRDVKTHLYDLPPLTKRTDAIQSFESMETLVVELRTSEGLSGTGYGYTIGTGGRAAKAFLDRELAPLLTGEDCEAHQRIWDKMYNATRASSGGPISSIARAAVDIAVWDIKAKARNTPLCTLLGGAQKRVPVYDTEGGWLHASTEELVENARRTVEKGFRGVKIKVGKENAGEDVRRLEAVRKAVGPDLKIMVDANQGWSTAEAIRRAKLFEALDLFWLEEPLLAGAVESHRQLKEHTSIPIAVGETIYTKEMFAEYVRNDAASILQPDVARIAGITEWMKIASLAEAFQMPVAPHFLMEIQVHLAAAIPNGIFIEYIPQLGPVLQEEISVEDGCIAPPGRPGHGILFDWQKLEQFRVT
ncbi:MAG TPA: mandelate racemase/muconate lactonizing enzyme family protein [Terriglobia bacterium]|nr:mandelate racemase/muconate lactonizing enzyme family protein [Terriglobia bacterium]